MGEQERIICHLRPFFYMESQVCDEVKLYASNSHICCLQLLYNNFKFFESQTLHVHVCNDFFSCCDIYVANLVD